MPELIEAADLGNTSRIRELVERHDSKTTIDFTIGDDPRTPLFFAAANNHLDTVRYLLAKGAYPDVADAHGWSVLHVAAQKGSLDVIRELKKAGANPFAVNELQHTPLEEAKLSEMINETRRGEVSSLLHEWMIGFNAKALLSQYKSFDTEFISKNLTLAYKKDQSFHFHYPKILRHIVRKQGLSSEILQLIYDDFLKVDLDARDTHLLDLAQIIKYSVMHGSAITIEQLINGLKTVADPVVQAELLYAITHKIKKESITLESTQRQAIQEFAKSNCHFFDNSFFDIPRLTDVEASFISASSKLSDRKVLSLPKTEVVKELHTTRVTHVHKQAEQVDLDIKTLLDLLKKKNQGTQKRRQFGQMPLISDTAGNDQQWYRSTFYEVKNLYARAESTLSLKEYDKDTYLPEKLLSPDSKWFAGTEICKFFIDRMICSIFATVSEKQKLHPRAITKLMLCIDTLDSFKQKLFGTHNNADIAKKLIDDDIREQRYKGDLGIIANIAGKLYSEGLIRHEKKEKKGFLFVTWDEVKVWYSPVDAKIISIIDSELNTMRAEALTAIYNSIRRDPSILSAKDLKKIQERLRDSDREVKKLAIKIISVLDDSPGLDPSELLSAYLSQLESTELSQEETEIAINYFIKQLSREGASQLITETHITRIIACISKPQFNSANRLGFLDIIFAYQASVRRLSLPQLQSIVSFMTIAGQDELTEECIRIILQYADKEKTLPSNVLDELTRVAHSISPRASSLLVMVIANLGATAFNYNELAFKLQDESVMVQEGDKLVFVKRSKDHASSPSVASLLAQSILQALSLSTPKAANVDTVTKLVAALHSEDKTTKILSARVLFALLSKNLLPKLIDQTELFDLQMAIQDPIADVTVYATLFYLEGLRTHAKQTSPILTSHLNYLPKLYVLDRLLFSTSDYTEQVNGALFEIWSKEVRKKQLLTDDFFNLVDMVFVSINGQEHPAARQFLTIISDYISIAKHPIPVKMIHVLENLLCTPGYGVQAQTMLLGIIRNGQAVGERSLMIFKDQLFKEENNTEIIECLMLADMQQDLPEDVFAIVEMEEAVSCLEQVVTDEYAWQTIETATARGSKLTTHAINFLTRINSLTPTLLSIYKNMVANGQMLRTEQLDLLFEQYRHDESIRCDLLAIFLGVEKNGQVLPDKLLTYLEPSLTDPAVLSLFLNKAQRGEQLSAVVIERIIQFAVTGVWDTSLSRSVELSIKSALLNFISQQMQKIEKPGAEYEAIFLRSITDSHHQLVEYGLNGLMNLQEHGDLSLSTIDQLCTKLSNCHDLREKTSIQALLSKAKLTASNYSACKLLTIGNLSDEDYLTLCEEHFKVAGLFAANVNRIHQIALSKPQLQERALTLLLSCIKPGELTEHQLSDLKKLKLGSKSCLGEILNRLRSKLEPTVLKLKLEEHIKVWEDSVLPMLPAKLSTSAHSSVFFSPIDLEKEALLRSIAEQEISEEVLTEYYRLFSRLADTDLQAVSLKLIPFFLSAEDEHLRLVVLKLIILSCGRVPSCYQTFLEALLTDADPKIRSQAFLGLMHLPSMDLSADFTEVCSDLMNEIEMYSKVRVENLKYLQIIFSLNECHFPVGMPEETWIKCFILADWYALWQLNDVEKYALYEKWSVVEELLPNPDVVLTWLHALPDLSHAQLSAIMQNMEYLAEDLTSLINNPLTDFVSLRKTWLKRKLMGDTTAARSEKPLLTIDPVILDDVLQMLARDLPLEVAERWLPCFIQCNRIDEIRKLIKLVGKYKELDFLDCDVSDATLDQLDHAVQMKILSHQFMRLAEKDHLHASLNKLLIKGWSFEQLERLIEVARTKSDRFENDLLQCLTVLANYEVSAQHIDRIADLMLKHDSSRWVLQLNELVIEESFSLTPIIKNPEQLLADLIKDNEGSALVSGLTKELLSDMQQIVGGQLPVCTWSREQILEWSGRVKSQPEYFSDKAHLVEAIALAARAYFILTGFQLTNTQILSCLLALKEVKDSKEVVGRLLQVQTGEGKTAIISIIAIIKALQGQKVDVVTSSPVEAERCAREQMAFYQLFGVSVADNLDRSPYLKGAKRCYRSDVVYGEMAQFQFDALRDEYALLGTRGGRPYGAIVADEVDSMMIDDSTKIAKLSSTIAGMDQLREPYYFVTYQVKYLLDHIIDIDGQTYYFPGKVEIKKDGRYELHYCDKDGLKKIDDLRELIKFSDVNSVGGECITGDATVYIEQAIERYLDELISGGILTIPEHFKDLFAKQKSKWVKNAMAGHAEFHENMHYIVQDNLVKPVAYTSNGVVQNSTQWNDGLQQALQIKHHLAVSSESFTTNFISNWAYFERYKGLVCGLTGTLGTPFARTNLEKTYHVQCVDVPSMRQKQYKQLPTMVMANQRAWMSEIYFETMHEVNKNRGVLIICQTIDEVLSLEQFIKANNRAALVKTYTMNGCDQEKAIERIQPGEIFIATSLGGRGMDIKADAINRAGGMHVILASALDDRNSKQALARTARQGKLGTGRRILNQNQLLALGYQQDDLKDIEGASERFEAEQLDLLFGKPLELIKLKDLLFKKFCALLLEIRSDAKKKSRGLVRDATDTVLSIFSDLNPRAYETNVVAAIEERWAMLLLKIEDGTITPESVETEYKAFEAQIRKEYELQTLLQNPCHLIAVGNELVADSYFDEAKKYYDRAIAKDEKASAAAYVGRAWIHLKNRLPNYKNLAIEEFSSAIRLLYDELAHTQALQVLMQEQHIALHSKLMQQLTQRINLIGSYVKSIESAVESIKRSQRLMTVTTRKHYQNKNSSKPYYNAEQSGEHSTQLEVARIDGHLPFELSAAANYDLSFNHLTVYQDMGSIDQATKTIEAAFAAKVDDGDEKKSILDNYRGLSIEMPLIDLAAIKDFFSPDVVHKQLSQPAALKELEAKISYLHKWTRGILSSQKVTIEIFSGETLVTQRKEVALLEALELVRSTAADKTISLRYLKANKTVNSLSAELLDLNKTEAQLRLKDINSSSFDLELMGTTEQLLAILEDEPSLSQGTLVEFEKSKRVERDLYRDSLLQLLREKPTDKLTVRFNLLTRDRALTIIEHCNEVKLNLRCNEIDVAASLPGLESGIANVQFTKLDQTVSTELIGRLREKRHEFIVSFADLTKTQLETVVRGANLTQEEIDVTSKPLATLFLDKDKPEVELAELAARGMEYLLELNERNFIPWRSVMTVSLLAAIQISAGAALVVSGFGATVGMGLITEGVADVITAARAVITRQFTWTDYCKQKAVSLVISAACMGLQAIGSAGRAVKTMVTAASEEVLVQAGEAVVNNGRAVGQTLVQSTKQLQVLVTKHIGVSLAEAGAREVLNNAADSLSHAAFDQFKPQISAAIRADVDVKFCDTELSRLVAKLYVLDELQKSSRFTQRTDHLVHEILNPARSFWRQQWDSIGLPLVKGLLSAPDKLRTPASVGFRMAGILNGIGEVMFVIDRFHGELHQQLKGIDAEFCSMPSLLQQYCALTEEDALAITTMLQQHDVIRDHQIISIEKLLKIDFKAYHLHQPKVAGFLRTLHGKMNLVEARPLVSMIARLMTDHIIQTAESQLVMPLTSYAVGEGVSFVSSQIQQAIIRAETKVKMSELEAELVVLETKDSAEAANDAVAILGDLAESQMVLASEQTLTYGAEIHRVADKKVIAHSQCTMISSAAKKDDGVKRLSPQSQDEVSACAASVREEGTADLSIMVKMAADNDVPLKIVDASYSPTEQDIANNVQFAVFIPGDLTADGAAEIGHWCTKDNYGDLVSIDSEGNDCGYAVMSQLIRQAGKGEKSVAELRAETANSIETSPSFYYALEAQHWLQSYNASAANDLVFNGGKKKKKEDIVLKIDDPQMSIINDTYNASQASYNSNCQTIGELDRIDFKKVKGFNTAIGVYRNRNNGDIVIAFQGTDFERWKSVVDTLPLVSGVEPICTGHSEVTLNNFLTQLQGSHPGSKVILTGHSKGAALACILSERYGLPAIVYDNPGIGGSHDFNKVLSIQSTPNAVNGRRFAIEGAVSYGTDGFGGSITDISTLKRGTVLDLKDGAGLCRRFCRWVGHLLVMDSHALNHMGDLIKDHKKNKKHIKAALQEFGYGAIDNEAEERLRREEEARLRREEEARLRIEERTRVVDEVRRRREEDSQRKAAGLPIDTSRPDPRKKSSNGFFAVVDPSQEGTEFPGTIMQIKMEEQRSQAQETLRRAGL